MTPWEIVEAALAHRQKNQQWLADKLRLGDSGAQTVNNWKRRGLPTRSDLRRDVAAALGLTIDQLEGLVPLPWERPVEWPFEDVPRDLYFDLSEEERVRVQAAMMGAIHAIRQERLRAVGAGKRVPPGSIDVGDPAPRPATRRTAARKRPR